MAKQQFDWSEILNFEELKQAEKLLEELRNEIKRLAKETQKDVKLVDKADTASISALIDRDWETVV